MLSKDSVVSTTNYKNTDYYENAVPYISNTYTILQKWLIHAICDTADFITYAFWKIAAY